MSTVPQTVGKSGRQKMRNDFHSGFESRVTVGNNNNTKKVIKITKNNKVSNDNKIIKKMRNYFYSGFQSRVAQWKKEEEKN